MTPRRIYLVRHGETASNAARVFQLPETPLSPRGVDQAERLAARLAGDGIALVLASGFSRAAMTAEPLARAAGAPIEIEPLLEERNFGALRGRPYAELEGDAFARDYEPPGGELWPVFEARVDRAWERIRAAAVRSAGHLAVVTHGLVCASLVARHLRLMPGAGLPRGFPNASLTLVDGEPPFAVTLLACTAHLGAQGAPPGGLA
jgi:broad specificity phosphatase PhoE